MSLIKKLALFRVAELEKAIVAANADVDIRRETLAQTVNKRNELVRELAELKEEMQIIGG